MAITTIPETYRAGLSKIKNLSSSDVEALLAALEKSPTARGMKGMISTVDEQAPSLKREHAEDIVRTLYSLYVLRADSDTPLSEFVSELISAMRATGKEPLTLSEEQKDEFQNKMTRLLSLDTLVIASKIEQLKLDYAYNFQDARILTDIRPIFSKPEERPIGAAITHTLKIEYHEVGKHRELYIALDAQDLEKMKKVLQRAEAKASSLKSLLKATSLADLS